MAVISPETGGMEQAEQVAPPARQAGGVRRPRPFRGAGPSAGRGGRTGLLAVLRRPLTSYYLILGITTLLLALGLVMVLST